MSQPLHKTKEFRGAIFGMLLGDAYIFKSSGCSHYSIGFEHSITQETYCKFKHKIISKLTKANLRTRKRKNPWGKFHKINKKTVESIIATSRMHPFYTKLRKLFYPSDKKIVTRRILDELTPFGLALWYMDDGSLCLHRHKAIYDENGENISFIKSRSLKLSTQSFSEVEHFIMQKYFLEKWQVKFKIKTHSGSDNKLCLIANATNANKFIDIIHEFIIPLMFYKIDMKYSYGVYVRRHQKSKVDSELYGNIQSYAEMS